MAENTTHIVIIIELTMKSSNPPQVQCRECGLGRVSNDDLLFVLFFCGVEMIVIRGLDTVIILPD